MIYIKKKIWYINYRVGEYMKKRIILIICGFLVLCIIGLVFVNLNKNKDRLKEVKTVHDIDFSVIKISKLDDKYLVKVKVVAKKKSDVNSINVELKDRNNKSLAVLRSELKELKKDKEEVIEIKTYSNLKGAYEAIYTVYKE